MIIRALGFDQHVVGTLEEIGLVADGQHSHGVAVGHQKRAGGGGDQFLADEVLAGGRLVQENERADVQEHARVSHPLPYARGDGHPARAQLLLPVSRPNRVFLIDVSRMFAIVTDPPEVEQMRVSSRSRAAARGGN